MEDILLLDSIVNIWEFVVRLGEIEDEMSDSGDEGMGMREMMKKFLDEEFEEIERLLYEEKVCIEVEKDSMWLVKELVNEFFDDEFEWFEKVLYE